VRRKWGDMKERLWIGHSERVMEKHYAVLSDDEFAAAAGVAVKDKISHVELHANPTEQDSVLRGK